MPAACAFAKTLGDLLQISQTAFAARLVAVDLLAQSNAVDKLHRDEVHAFALADFVDVRDVRMIERGRGFASCSKRRIRS